MIDRDLQRLVHDALSQRDRRQPAPAFAKTWRAAQREAGVRHARRPPGAGWFKPALAFTVVAAVALASVWHVLGGPGQSPSRTDDADLRLARELSPSRQWPTATDALLHPYHYAPADPIEIPGLAPATQETLL